MQAKAELDNDLRGEIYRDMAVIMRDEGGSVVPYFPNYVFARRDNVMRRNNIAANWPLDGFRYASRWWFGA